MTPSEIDQAIAALPDQDHANLCDAAAKHWTFVAQTYALISAALLTFFALSLLAHRLLWWFWPGSLVAATVAVLGLLSCLWVSLKVAMSWRVTDWRMRSAMRRVYRSSASVHAS
jgi:hypothetical protein